MRTAPRQLELTPRHPNVEHPGWGGPRPGAGRPTTRKKYEVPHRRRPALAGRFPVHVTLRIRRDVGNLRTKERAALLRRAFKESSEQGDFRLVHYSVQRDHIHLIVEADDEAALARGVSSLKIRVAKRLNARLGRRGAVFVGRYHSTILETPKQVRATVAYVLLNGRKHRRGGGPVLPPDVVDYHSSGIYFDGWDGRVRLSRPYEDGLVPTASPRTWLLRLGWRRHGLIRPDAVPGE